MSGLLCVHACVCACVRVRVNFPWEVAPGLLGADEPDSFPARGPRKPS